MGTILSGGQEGSEKSNEISRANVLLFRVTGEDPSRLNNRDTHLKCLLILNTWCTRDTTSRLRTRGRRRRGRAHEVGRVDLDAVAPARAHLAERDLGVFEEDIVFDRPETYGDAGGIGHGMRTDAEEVK